MEKLQPLPHFKSKGLQLSPVDDQPKVKDVIQKLVDFSTNLAITIATVDRLATQAPPHQVTTPPEQPSPSRPSAGEKPPAITSAQSSFLDTPDKKWNGKEEEQPQPRRRTKLHCRRKGT